MLSLGLVYKSVCLRLFYDFAIFLGNICVGAGV